MIASELQLNPQYQNKNKSNLQLKTNTFQNKKEYEFNSSKKNDRSSKVKK
jgi:hypothetical protein